MVHPYGQSRSLWYLCWEGWEVTNGLPQLGMWLGRIAPGAPHPNTHTSLVDHATEASKIKNVTFRTRNRRPLLLQCPFNVLYWQSFNISDKTYCKGQMLKEPSLQWLTRYRRVNLKLRVSKLVTGMSCTMKIIIHNYFCHRLYLFLISYLFSFIFNQSNTYCLLFVDPLNDFNRPVRRQICCYTDC